jgi:hypothetical protein
MKHYLRLLRDIIGDYWSMNKAPGINDIGKKYAPPLRDEERLWNKLIEAGGCCDCHAKPKMFVEGPSGGMCQNVFCAQCGQGYNLTPLAHYAERIHKDLNYVARPSPPTAPE